jgi:hypothetical protein
VWEHTHACGIPGRVPIKLLYRQDAKTQPSLKQSRLKRSIRAPVARPEPRKEEYFRGIVCCPNLRLQVAWGICPTVFVCLLFGFAVLTIANGRVVRALFQVSISLLLAILQHFSNSLERYTQATHGLNQRLSLDCNPEILHSCNSTWVSRPQPTSRAVPRVTGTSTHCSLLCHPSLRSTSSWMYHSADLTQTIAP